MVCKLFFYFMRAAWHPKFIILLILLMVLQVVHLLNHNSNRRLLADWRKNQKSCVKFAGTKQAESIMEWHHVTVAEDFLNGVFADWRPCTYYTLEFLIIGQDNLIYF